MRLIIAPDSFKGTLTAPEAAKAMADGFRRARPAATIECVPLADGGEGTLNVLIRAAGGERRDVPVTGPLGAAITASIGLIDARNTAVIEMAHAAGLLLVPPGRRDVMRATTFGVGELICRALDMGVRRVLIGVGGSATSDGGAACAQALGVRFVAPDGELLAPGLGGGQLDAIDRIDLGHRRARLRDTELTVLCDVRNPLIGPDGAARVYAPQKGATPAQVDRLEANLTHYATVVERDTGVRVAALPGAGAAGGLAAGLHALAGANLAWGAEAVIHRVGLAARCQGADAIITGEGSLDAQSLQGKVVAAVGELGRRMGVPVFVLAGRVRLDAGAASGRFGGVAAVCGPDEELSDNPFAALVRRAAECAHDWFT